MMPPEKRFWDILVAAEWIENVIAPPGKGRTIKWVTGKARTESGAVKMAVFAVLYRELAKAGPLSSEEIRLVVEMGEVFLRQGPPAPEIGK